MTGPILTRLQPIEEAVAPTVANQVLTWNGSAYVWAVPASGGVSDGDKGDITVSGGGTVWTVDAGVVTLAKQADVATGTVFYRKTAGTGSPEVQTLATLKTDLGLSGTNTGDQTITLTGDVTGSGTGSFAATISNDAVSNAKLANVSTATLKGRVSAGSGDPEDLTGTQATTLLDVFTSALKGLAPASGGGTTNFLRADGTWAAPSGGGGGGANVGTATVDFGAFPGSSHASVVVTGQAGIVAGSVVQAWVRPVATADHSADEHMLETLKVHASDIVAGTGFTINVFNDGTINEPDVAAVSRDNVSQIAARAGGRGRQDVPATTASSSRGTRIYGQWTIAWSWS